jgi:hypothetical protein
MVEGCELLQLLFWVAQHAGVKWDELDGHISVGPCTPAHMAGAARAHEDTCMAQPAQAQA